MPLQRALPQVGEALPAESGGSPGCGGGSARPRPCPRPCPVAAGCCSHTCGKRCAGECCCAASCRPPNSVSTILCISSEIPCAARGSDLLHVCLSNGARLRLHLKRDAIAHIDTVYFFPSVGHANNACRGPRLSSCLQATSL